MVEGRKEDIEDFYEYLEAKMPPAARNPGLGEIEFGDFGVVDRRDAALSLNLNQWNTAIPVVIAINKNVMSLGEQMGGLGEQMHDGFERMNTTLEALPERIAQAFKDIK